MYLRWSPYASSRVKHAAICHTAYNIMRNLDEHVHKVSCVLRGGGRASTPCSVPLAKPCPACTHPRVAHGCCTPRQVVPYCPPDLKLLAHRPRLASEHHSKRTNAAADRQAALNSMVPAHPTKAPPHSAPGSRAASPLPSGADRRFVGAPATHPSHRAASAPGAAPPSAAHPAPTAVAGPSRRALGLRPKSQAAEQQQRQQAVATLAKEAQLAAAARHKTPNPAEASAAVQPPPVASAPAGPPAPAAAGPSVAKGAAAAQQRAAVNAMSRMPPRLLGAGMRVAHFYLLDGLGSPPPRQRRHAQQHHHHQQQQQHQGGRAQVVSAHEMALAHKVLGVPPPAPSVPPSAAPPQGHASSAQPPHPQHPAAAGGAAPMLPEPADPHRARAAPSAHPLLAPGEGVAAALGFPTVSDRDLLALIAMHKQRGASPPRVQARSGGGEASAGGMCSPTRYRRLSPTDQEIRASRSLGVPVMAVVEQQQQQQQQHLPPLAPAAVGTQPPLNAQALRQQPTHTVHTVLPSVAGGGGQHLGRSRRLDA